MISDFIPFYAEKLGYGVDSAKTARLAVAVQ